MVDVTPVVPKPPDALDAAASRVHDCVEWHCRVDFPECFGEDLEIIFLAAGCVVVNGAERVLVGEGFAWGHVPADVVSLCSEFIIKSHLPCVVASNINSDASKLLQVCTICGFPGPRKLGNRFGWDIAVFPAKDAAVLQV